MVYTSLISLHFVGMLLVLLMIKDDDDDDDNSTDADVYGCDQGSVDTALTHHSGQSLSLSCMVLLESREEQRPDSPLSAQTTSPVPALLNR